MLNVNVNIHLSSKPLFAPQFQVRDHKTFFTLDIASTDTEIVSVFASREQLTDLAKTINDALTPKPATADLTTAQ